MRQFQFQIPEHPPPYRSSFHISKHSSATEISKSGVCWPPLSTHTTRKAQVSPPLRRLRSFLCVVSSPVICSLWIETTLTCSLKIPPSTAGRGCSTEKLSNRVEVRPANLHFYCHAHHAQQTHIMWSSFLRSLCGGYSKQRCTHTPSTRVLRKKTYL